MIREFLSSYGSGHILPSICGIYRGKNVVVCADAACIWQDLEMFGCKAENSVAKTGWDFFTVNKMVEVFPGKIEHAYSNSAHCLTKYIEARRDEYINEFGNPRWSHSMQDGTSCQWPWSGHGTSGLGAVLTAVALGYENIVLCGMPLDGGPHNGEPYWRRTGFETEVPDRDMHWKRAIDLAFDGKVRSMSGRTKEWLGGV